jgi:hypothetical protein
MEDDREDHHGTYRSPQPRCNSERGASQLTSQGHNQDVSAFGYLVEYAPLLWRQLEEKGLKGRGLECYLQTSQHRTKTNLK